jgi:hypothetical protein
MTDYHISHELYEKVYERVFAGDEFTHDLPPGLPPRFARKPAQIFSNLRSIRHKWPESQRPSPVVRAPIFANHAGESAKILSVK